MIFLNEGFFNQLRYNEIGTNLQSERSTGSGIADYITIRPGDDIRDSQTVVYEFKKPKKALTNHEQQLFEYMSDTAARFGVLSNGIGFQLYRQTPTSPELIKKFPLRRATDSEASLLIHSLGYWGVTEEEIRPMAEMVVKKVADEIPPQMRMDFSEATIELFSKHLGRYLKKEFNSTDTESSTRNSNE